MRGMRLSRTHQAGFLILSVGLFFLVAHSIGTGSSVVPGNTPTSLQRLPAIKLADPTGSQYDLSSLGNSRFLLVLAGDDTSKWLPSASTIVDCATGAGGLPVVVVCQVQPPQEILDECRTQHLSVLMDPAGQIAKHLNIATFPRLLFVSEKLTIAGSRGMVAGDFAAGFTATLARFAEGASPTKLDLNFISIGQPLPLLLDEELGDKASKIMAASPGTWLILHFSSTCTGCRTELEELKTIVDSGGGVPVLGVTTSPQEEIVQLLGEVGITIPVMYDVDGRIRVKHDISALPTAFAVDGDGKVVGKMVGYSQSGFANLVVLCSGE